MICPLPGRLEKMFSIPYNSVIKYPYTLLVLTDTSDCPGIAGLSFKCMHHLIIYTRVCIYMSPAWQA